MLVNENELKSCLLYGLETFLKEQNLEIIELDLSIKDRLFIKSKFYFNQQLMTLKGSCILDYDNQEFVIKEIDGIIEYLFLKFSIVQVLKQYLNNIKIINNDIYIPYQLPILFIEYHDGYVDIKIA